MQLNSTCMSDEETDTEDEGQAGMEEQVGESASNKAG